MTKRLIRLDSLRGIAALALVLFHVQGIPKLACSPLVQNIINRCGSGVPLFYAISAFSLILGYQENLNKSDGLAHFYLRRFFRIMPLFYVMLCFWILMRTFYFHASTSFSDMVLNTSCLFGLFPSTHEGLVWASWSIGVEWIFYVFFPVLAFISSTLLSSTVLFIASLAISVASAKTLETMSLTSPTFSYMSFGTQLIFFSGGLFAFKVVEKLLFLFPAFKIKTWLPNLLICLALGCTVLLSKASVSSCLSAHCLATQAIVLVWLLLLISSFPNVKSIIDHSWLQRAGKLSFSLYLLNPPIIFGLSQIGFYRYWYSFCGASNLGFITAVVFSIQIIWIAAEISFFFIEQPAIYFGEMIRIHFTKDPEEALKLQQKMLFFKAPRSKLTQGILFICFILTPWLIWSFGELKYKQNKISESLFHAEAIVKEIELAKVPVSYQTAVISPLGPWIENISINKKQILKKEKGAALVVHPGDVIELSGWAADINHPLPKSVAYLVLESQKTGEVLAALTSGTKREDVADFYHKKELQESGFYLIGKIPLSLCGSKWNISLLTTGTKGSIKIPTNYTLTVLTK